MDAFAQEHQVPMIPIKLTRRTPPPKPGYRTRVITSGVSPSLHITYKHTDHTWELR